MNHTGIQQIFDRLMIPAGACTMCGGAKQVVEGHNCPRCNGTGRED
jgi:hypothetical protein